MDNSIHHYVPQFYLKRFVGTDDLLWVYDKDFDKVFPANPKNLAAERGFYALPEVFPDSSAMEQQFSELEQEAALITENWLCHLEPGCEIAIPHINREIMSLFIATQLIRTSEVREILVQHVSSQQTEPVASETARALQIELLWNDQMITELSGWVHDCTWTFRVNKLSDSLYTSDDPFKARTRTRHLHWAQLPTPGAYLLIPLTPRVLMYCFDLEGWEMLRPFDRHVISKPLEPELVSSANVHQIGHARRFIISDQDDFQMARDFCARYPGAVGQKRRRFND